MKKIFLKILLGVVMLLNVSHANEIEQIKNEFNGAFQVFIHIAKDKTLTKEVRDKKIIDAIEPLFDFELMSKLSLGKVWKTLTKEQKYKFTQAYVAKMKRSYSSKIDLFSNKIIKIKDAKKTKGNRLVLHTYITDKDTTIDINYKYYRTKKEKPNKKRWLIYDVSIKGISIIKTDRAQFKSILKREKIDTLIDKMK